MNKTDKILNYLKLERKKQKITQKELAESLQIAKETYRDIESGRIPLKVEILLNICKVLKVDPTSLMIDGDDFIIKITKNQANAINDLYKQIQTHHQMNHLHDFTDNGDFYNWKPKKKIMSVIENISQIRKNKKISRKEMAKYLFMTDENYKKIEYGEVRLTLENYLIICNVLKISPIELLKESGDED